MKIHRFTKMLLSDLREETGCGMQFNNCPCRTCFHNLCRELKLSDERATQFWGIVLILRGDYTEKEI